MENNYCAIVRKCEQVSPDDWEMITRTFQVNDNTTMREIADWYNKEFSHSSRMHIVIAKLETPQP